MWLDSHFTISERRGLLLLALLLLLTVGMVWLFSGHTHQSVVDAVTPGKSNVVSTDSLRLPDSTVIVNKTRSKRSKKKVTRQTKPLEPRWNPLDEPVPQTK